MTVHLRLPTAAPAARRADPAFVALTATLGLAAAAWLIAVRQMRGMDMGVATDLGPFWPFVGLWIAMMAAMMLPGAAVAVARQARVRGVRAVPAFVASYLAVWTFVGIAGYPLYRSHGTIAAGLAVIAAGLYELTPLKQGSRRQCRVDVRSGVRYGLCCVGSSIGLMLTLLMLGAMNVAWMAVIALLVTAQKLVPAKRAIDIAVALAIVALGTAIVLTPAPAGWW